MNILGSPSTGTAREQSFSNTSTPAPEQTPFSKYLNLGRGWMDIKDIRKEIMNMKRAGMPHNLVPPEVYESLCMRAVRKWEAPLDTYMAKSMELLRETVHNALVRSLDKLRQRLVFKESQVHLTSFLDKQEAGQQARLTDRFNDETYQMFTLNTEAFDRFKVKEAEVLERARIYARLKSATLLDWSYVMSPLEKMSAEAKKKENQLFAENLPKIGDDPFKTELEVAATVRGYYMTAATYFVEGVTKDVNSRLFRALSDTALDFHLEDSLGLSRAGKSKPDASYSVMPLAGLMDCEAFGSKR
jgi:hypothetical protein